MINFEYQDNTRGWEEDLSKLPKSQSFSKKVTPGQETVPLCHTENLQEETQTITSAHLKRITFPNQNLEIVFNYANDRQDIGANQSVQRLSAINVLHKQAPLESYTFNNNDYFIGSDSPIPSYLNKRLKLNSITENLKNTSYLFEYNEEYRMPSYVSPDTDHWGYYNCAGNISLLPNTIPDAMSQLYHYSPFYLTADKETNPNSTKACALKKIIYPTGGFSQFTWEANVISYDSISELKNNSWNIYYDRNSYVPTQGESSFITYMRSLYVDDPGILSANIRMQAFNKYADGTVNINITGLGAGLPSGYYRVYLYKFMDNPMPGGRPLMPIPFDILNHPDCTQLSNNQNLIVSRGAYYLIILATNNPNVNYISCGVNYKELEMSHYIDKNVGGLRIKEINHGDGLISENTITHRYYYKRDFLTPGIGGEPAGYQRSSGKLFMDPYRSDYKYHYESKCAQSLVATSYMVDGQGEPYYFEGSHIGYGEVTEIVSDNSGCKITKFWNDEDIIKRDLVLSEHWYDKDKAVKKEVLNNYVSYSSFQNPVSRMNIRLVYSYRIPDLCDFCYILFSTLSPATTHGMWFGINKRVEKTYTATGTNFIRDSVLYYYDAASLGKHTFVTRKIFSNSDNAEVVETYKYAQDFTPSENFIKRMVSNHIINEPVEQVRKMNSVIIGAYYKKYLADNSKEIYECDFSKYPAINSGIDQYGNLLSNTYYRKRYSLDMDIYGNLLSVVKDGLFPTSFIYGYNNTRPVVAIENINYYQINPSIIANIRTHVFSESGQPHDISGDINFVKSSLGALYSDKNYLVNIYTYKPLVGITSITDPKGMTKYYEYDSSGHLQYIRDTDRKAIEQYDYHYKP